MKILLISGSYPPIKCGVGDYTYMLCNELAKEHDISVLTSKNAYSGNSGITVLNRISTWKGIKLVREIVREIKKGEYDIVHFQFPTSEYVRTSFAFYVLLPIILKLKRIKTVYTIHEYSNNSYISKLMRKPAIYCSKRVIVVESSFKQEIIKRNKFINKNKIRVINIGSNIPKSTASFEQVKKLRFSILNEQNQNNIIIAYFGFVNEAKCLDIILKALGELKCENNLKSTFLIIGEFNDRKCNSVMYERLVNIIKSYGLDDNIYITGYVENNKVGDYFRAADVALLLFKNGVSLRNGSMLAAQQEGIKIITSVPKYDFEYFNNKQFCLIENEVEQVKNEIVNIQNEGVMRYNKNEFVQWHNIACEHIQLYKDLIGADLDK